MRGTAIAPVPVSAAAPTTSSLRLGQAARRILWSLVFILELSNAALLAALATIYYGHSIRGTFLWVVKLYFLFYDAYHFLEAFSYAVATGYAILSIVFMHYLIVVVYTSLRHRRLLFGLTSIKPAHGPSVKDTRGALATRTSRMRAWWHRFHSKFGVQGQYFEIRHLADEVVELAAQIHSARTASESISSVALNQTYGLVIFLNSISTPVFLRVFSRPEDLVKQRVTRLLTNLVLDFVWGTLLPIWMYGPIFQQYWKQRDHGIAVDNTENSAREVERVLVLSWSSFLLSVIPFCNSLLNLVEVRALLREEVVSTTNTSAAKERSMMRLSMSNLSSGRIKSMLTRRGSQHLQRVAYLYIFHILHMIMSCVGVGFFFVSAFASGIFGNQIHEASYECVHRVHPWFTTKEACIGRSIDCSALGVQGTVDDIEAALRVFDAPSLADLFIANCPALNMSTPFIQRFSRLQTLEISNATIVSWDEEVGALSSHRFPGLRTVKLKDVTLAAPPNKIALFTTPISHSVEWIYISDTDMSDAFMSEEAISTNWKDIFYLDCARCQLSAFPTTVVQSMKKLIMMSLIGTNISHIPSTWPTQEQRLVMVWFDGNSQLQELSDSLWRLGAISLTSVYAQHTALVSLPSWVPETVAPNKEFVLYAYNTPLCGAGEDDLPSFVSCVDQAL